MCGFILNFNDAVPIDRIAFDAARDSMSHRGPDAYGSDFLRDGRVALGHRRLSIQDLSEAANQPMRLGNLWVVYNGEIYNFPELKRELEQHGCVFRTHCDTEVLLHGYRVWGGEKLCEKCRGMFAFCLWDDDAGTLFAARDHVGQKPFYYFFDGTRFIAASEPKAIFALLGRRPPVRREAFKEFLIYDDVPDPFTWYQGLMSLPAGHSLTLKMGCDVLQPRISEYWAFRPPESPSCTSKRSALAQLGSLLEKSMGMHQLADVEVGAFLSGGLDSSGVVAMTAKGRSDRVGTYSIGYENDEGELPLARQVAEQWNCRHHEHRISDEGLAEALERSSDVFDMPFGDSSQFPTYEVAKFASRDVKVVLTGDGGDEVLGGYWELGKYMGHHKMDTSSLFEILYGLKHWREHQQAWQSTYNFGHCTADNDIAQRMLGAEFADLEEYDGMWFYKKHWLPELDPFRRAQWNDFKCYLPTVLKKVDRCTMQHSLEARCPLLLPELIEFAFSLPTSVKNPKGQFKHLYKQWLQNERLIPKELFAAPKKGFEIGKEAKSRFQHSARIKEAITSAQNKGILSEYAGTAAAENWGRAWRLALVGGFT